MLDELVEYLERLTTLLEEHEDAEEVPVPTNLLSDFCDELRSNMKYLHTTDTD